MPFISLQNNVSEGKENNEYPVLLREGILTEALIMDTINYHNLFKLFFFFRHWITNFFNKHRKMSKVVCLEETYKCVILKDMFTNKQKENVYLNKIRLIHLRKLFFVYKIK